MVQVGHQLGRVCKYRRWPECLAAQRAPRVVARGPQMYPSNFPQQLVSEPMVRPGSSSYEFPYEVARGPHVYPSNLPNNCYQSQWFKLVTGSDKSSYVVTPGPQVYPSNLPNKTIGRGRLHCHLCYASSSNSHSSYIIRYIGCALFLVSFVFLFRLFPSLPFCMQSVGCAFELGINVFSTMETLGKDAVINCVRATSWNFSTCND
ncbi:hypothetical protein HKD37_01G002101 [Glycine soja]